MIGRLTSLSPPPPHAEGPTGPSLTASRCQGPASTPCVGPEDGVALAMRPEVLAEAPPAETPKISRTGRYVSLALAMIAAGGALVGSAFLPDLAPKGPPSPSVSRVVDGLAGLQADSLAWAREGRELSRGSILKPDHYPGLHHADLQQGKDPQPVLPGAPNFRKVQGRSIYGVAQPTVQGMREVLRQVGAGPGGQQTAYWTSMREEPVVYVNGRSFNVRELATPFANREAPGLSAEGLEARERQLKDEVLKEAAAHGGRLLIHEEMADGSLAARWEKVDSVQTPAEVYRDLQAEGFRVDYARIPVTDEKTPEPGDFDALAKRLAGLPEGAPQIFNCHAGRGRTTTAMVVAELLGRARSGSEPIRFTAHPSVHEDIREQGRYQRGEYRAILSLIQALSEGSRSKAEVDEVIDRSAALQNLRESIESYKDKSEAGGDPGKAEQARERGRDYLHRYFMLVTFDAYAREQAPQGFPQSFEDWLRERPELTEMLHGMELALNLPATGGGTAYA